MGPPEEKSFLNERLCTRLLLKLQLLMGSCDLESDAARSLFVDRTRWVKIFYDFHNHPAQPLFVSAPSGAGKTALVDIMDRYFRVEVDENHRPRPQKETSAYRLFTGVYGSRGRHFVVMNESYFFDEHIAAYPVVRLDFSTLHATTLDAFLRSAVSMVQGVVSAYPYVSSSLQNLGTTPGDSSLAGRNLTRDLHDYFKKKCVVLIDSFDHPATTLLRNSTPDAFKIRSWLAGFLDQLLRKNKHLEAGFLTGRSRLGEVYASNNTVYKSFVNSDLIGFSFGLSPDHVKDLLKGYNSSLTIDQLAREFCGYSINATDLRAYPTGSVIRSIESGKILETWKPGVSTDRFVQAFRLDAAGGHILTALRGGAVVLKLAKRVQFEDLEELREYLDGVNDKRFKYRQRSTPLFLQYLYELGYFTNIFEELGGYGNLRVPTLEIAHNLKSMLMKALAGEFIFNKARLAKLKDSVGNLDGSRKSCEGFLDAALAVVKPYLSDCRLRENILVILFYAVQSVVPDVLEEVLVPGGVGFDEMGQEVGYFLGFADTLVIPVKRVGVIINHKVCGTAFEALRQVFEMEYNKLISNSSRQVFIGLSFDTISKKMSATCLKDSTTLTLAFNMTVGGESKL
nr:PREDICTED: uncharacterized protein LOC109038240 isoform X2 [Bemisia tabaci]